MFLEFLIAGTGILLVIYLVLLFQQKKNETKIKENTRLTVQQYGEVSEIHGQLTVKINEEIYSILYIHVPANAELTINSRNKWDIHAIGKSHIIDQTQRLSSPYPKIVIVFPSTLRIKRYINENEMVFVSFSDKVYDFYVVRVLELEDLLKRLSQHA